MKRRLKSENSILNRKSHNHIYIYNEYITDKEIYGGVNCL